ncbi:MAG TPA: hypothetical protein DC047_05655 [Blastocatellia bacterium]|nr:hypothetical protein [Blastocatellia bacterium]
MEKQTVNSQQQTAGVVYGSRFTFSALLWSALFLLCVSSAHAQACPDPPPQTSGSHSFRQQGESFDIPISVEDCQPVSLELRWANGRNNGSNFQVTFLDSDNQAIYSKEISGFLNGSFLFPFATLEPRPSLSSLSLVSVPVKVTIEAVRPFAFPAMITYRVTRAALHPTAALNREAQIENREPRTGNSGKMEKAELLESNDGKTRRP